MIISGFPGVGKSTLARGYIRSEDHVFIDLESSCFGPPSERDPNWHKSYVRMADYLSRQGFHVLISSHYAVQTALQMIETDQVRAVLYPSIDLEDAWIERLRRRYEESGLEKDKRAFETAKEIYRPAVMNMSVSPIPNHIVLKSMDYNLRDEILNFMAKA